MFQIVILLKRKEYIYIVTSFKYDYIISQITYPTAEIYAKSFVVHQCMMFSTIH